MNSVHESGPNSDSKTLPSRKTRSKPSRLHEPPTSPAAHTGRAQVTRAWPCRGRSDHVVAGPPSRVAGQHGRIAALASRACVPPVAPAPLSARPRPALRAPPPRAPSFAHLQRACPCRTLAPSAALACAPRARPTPAQRPCLLSQYNPIVLRYKLA